MRVHDTAPPPEVLVARPFRGTEAVAKGLLSKRQLQGSAWVRLLPDVYAWSMLPLDRIARAQAVSLAAPDGGVISGRSAAWMLGVDVLRRVGEPIEITVGRQDPMRPRAGITIKRALVPDSDVDAVETVFHTNLYRTLFDLARRRRPGEDRDLIEAVAAFDAVTHRHPVDHDAFVAYATSHRGWRGVRLVPGTVGLADRRAESPMESRLRLLLIRSGLPRPAVQHEVVAGASAYRIDLAYPDERVAIEYDGDVHRDRWAADRRRQNNIEDLGWRFRRYTSYDYYRQPERIVTQISRLLRRS